LSYFPEKRVGSLVRPRAMGRQKGKNK